MAQTLMESPIRLVQPPDSGGAEQYREPFQRTPVVWFFLADTLFYSARALAGVLVYLILA